MRILVFTSFAVEEQASRFKLEVCSSFECVNKEVLATDIGTNIQGLEGFVQVSANERNIRQPSDTIIH